MTWDRECRPACNDHRNSTNEQCVTHCPVGPCIGNFQSGQPGSRLYNTADVNKQLVRAREKQLCGCMTRSYKTNKQNKPKEMILKADKDAPVECQ